MKSKEELLHEKMHIEIGMALGDAQERAKKDLEKIRKGEKLYYAIEIFVLLTMVVSYIYVIFFMRGIEGALLSLPLLWGGMNQFFKIKESLIKRREMIKAMEKFMELEFPMHDEEEPVKTDEKLKN